MQSSMAIYCSFGEP